jgi:glycosyltransferase involved in cell wall biosynthesis/Tfp pilus assembly protein PilF
MALRLTTTSLAHDNVATTAVGRRAADDEAARLLSAQAAHLLAAGDIPAFNRLFERAGAVEHELARYRARKLLAEAGLAYAMKAPARKAAEALIATADGVLGALGGDPARPLLLNYAGVTLYELWELDAAQALFEAARRLDPDTPHLDRNLAAVAERQRAHRRAGRKQNAVLTGLAAIAKRVAAAAKPAQGRHITLCMIMRDEEEMLPRTLQAIAPAVDEMIIVDTGSQDRSIEIAQSFGATVIEHPWSGDFSEARNVSLNAATGDWILYLDADEVLADGDADRLRAQAGHTWCEAIFLQELNYTGIEEVGGTVASSALRLIRNRPEYRFHGRLHEQIAAALPAGLPELLTRSTVRIMHYGYLGAVRESKDKSRRNLEILEQQRREQEPTPFLLFNLGSEYLALQENERACAAFDEVWELISSERRRGQGTNYHFLSALLSKRVAALRLLGHYQRAIAAADEGLELYPDFTDLVYAQGMAALALHDEQTAEVKLRRAIAMGDAPASYTSIVGIGSYFPRLVLAERALKRGDSDEALELMQWCLREHPEYYGTVHPYASALLKLGRSPDAVVAKIEREAGELTARMRFMLGVALFEQQAAAAAAAQFRLVLRAQPHSSPARGALVEALLQQRRYAEAASAAVPPERTEPPAWQLIQRRILALLLAHDTDGALQAVGDAARLGLGGNEQCLYRAWVARLKDSTATVEVPAGIAPELARTLGELLALQDFDNFEIGAHLFMATTLPLRERREQLAQLYLRGGFARSAAREWLAVCNEAPDLRALVGLAQVALTSQQPQTAQEFARQALALDPSSKAASEALAAASASLAATAARAAA